MTPPTPWTYPGAIARDFEQLDPESGRWEGFVSRYPTTDLGEVTGWPGVC